MFVHGEYFYGNKISKYGLDNGYVDYGTLSRAFDAVLNNDIISNTYDIGYWDLYSGSDYDEENDNYIDIFQYFIVSKRGAEILSEAGEIVYYNEKLDLYVWGVTHYGTSWNYVLTNVKCNVNYDYKKEGKQ